MMRNNYGALGATFQITRILQAVSLIAIIGMAANFIAEMVNASVNPPKVLIGTLSVVCVAVLYCAITLILFMDDHLPFIVGAIFDMLVLVALVVVAVVIGKPLSYLQCQLISDVTGGSSSAYAFTTALGNSLDKVDVNYSDWIGATRTTCFEMKSIWGLSIALCILFAFSMISSVCLWRRKKTEGGGGGFGKYDGPDNFDL